MRGPVSPDANIGAHPEGGGQAALFFEVADLSGDVIDRIAAGDPALRLLGRSVLGQLGVDIYEGGEATVIDNGLWLPIGITGHTEVGNALINDVNRLISETKPGKISVWHGAPLPFGRFADLDSLERLEADEVQHDIDQSVICLDPASNNISPRNDYYRINSDGSLSVKLAPVEFKVNNAHLYKTPGIPDLDIQPKIAPPDRRLELLHRGRPGIKRNSWIEQREPDDILPDFLLGGILISPGGRYWSIRPEIANGVQQIPSAALLDGNRIDGIGDHLDPYYRHRQVELVTSGENRPTFGDTYVTLDLYRPKEVSGDVPINWLQMSPAVRRSRHILGVTALQALETSDPDTRRALFDIVERPDVSAIVLSRKGISVVPEAGNHSGNRRLIKNELRLTPDGIPSGLRHLKPLIDRLGNAGDKTSTVIAEELKLEHLPDLVDDGGASAILAGRYVGEGGSITQDELSLLSSLSRQNVGIAQAENGDYREFHPMGLWVKPGVAERLRSERIFCAMFGAARTGVGNRLHSEIGRLMDDLVEFEGSPESLAFVHGNGDGVMRSACENARARNILSLGTGINAEKNGQGAVSTAADGVINMETLGWIVRQHQLNANASIAYVVEGAFGTNAEIDNITTSRKLLIHTPAPMFIRNPGGEFDGVRQQLKINGETALPNSARKWVPRTVHFIDDLSESLPVYARYRQDTTGYWERAYVPPKHIALVYENRRMVAAKTGIQIPGHELKAMIEYAGHLIHAEV